METSCASDAKFEIPDIEDIVIARPSKRDATVASRRRGSKKPNDEPHTAAPPSPRKKRVRSSKAPPSVKEATQPPPGWAELYAVVKEMRATGRAQHAPVDSMGCERLAQADMSPRDQRFQTLIALMLSSQTKDTTNAAAMQRLATELPAHAPGAPYGLTLENILAVAPARLNELIWAVGFHNNKTKYIKATAEILRDRWSSDIPDTIAGLVELPGVGPKMAYLCMSCAWGRTEGIGVDVHVHRITNRWRWHNTKTPEETRLALQAWLPRDTWHEINWMLVGLGQTICLPVGKKCGECALAAKSLCPAADSRQRPLPKTSVPKAESSEMPKIKTEVLETLEIKPDVSELTKIKTEASETSKIKIEVSEAHQVKTETVLSLPARRRRQPPVRYY
ncbi:BgTH12-03636 [Blumeria graminis f. sp. triticale]|uniref:Endonuclease III homolog n=3 Tax=Blumeria graminis TaxID=34373 RepID=A0A9X9L8G2_BLUGR|nr:DNA N-glycosylase [Blumeria graminis f. sp. tritici 96224]CAD6499525.1 BgTH12-03636 [Blumeria graminis f. sp. triticale]VCU39692.1 Bgt-1574 [Blumeria graminis f. sp. tritici]